MDPALSTRLAQDMIHALRGDACPLPALNFTGAGALNSFYPVTEFATASFAAASMALQLLRDKTETPVTIDSRLASLWFSSSHRPINRVPAALWDEFAGDYPAADGWIRLHTNAAHHRLAMENVLSASSSKKQLAARVATWRKEELEEAIVLAGGCAAAMRSHVEWLAHPQGSAVGKDPLFLHRAMAVAPPLKWQPPSSRPLLGIKILDLTRIIAGPVATRFLAGLGACVLRLDPPGWEEPTLAEEVTLGKRCARVDLKTPAGRELFQALLADADVIVHGYRADALEALGFDAQRRQQLSPGLVDVSLNAWGWSGPWRNRRGFDSLVQMACGIAARGQQWQQTNRPVPLPVQALDHAAGYLLAAAVLEGLRQRRDQQTGYYARLSLARVAALLMQHQSSQHEPLQPVDRHDQQPLMEWSRFGLGQRLKFPLLIPGMPVAWSLPPRPLGSDEARWQA